MMVTGGAGVPQQLLLLLLLQLTEELTGQRSAPQGEEEGPGDPPGGVLGMHQVTVVASASGSYALLGLTLPWNHRSFLHATVAQASSEIQNAAWIMKCNTH